MVTEETVGIELQPEVEQAQPAAEPVAPAAEPVAPAADSVAPKTDQESTPAKAEGRPSELEALKEGMRLRGRVRNIVEFGAFVDLGVGRDGLAHVSTLQRAGIDKTLKVGDMLDVQIRKIDLENNRISLTVPGAAHTPKAGLDTVKVGQELTGRIVRLVDFGAFVDIGAQTDGLVHISQLSGGFVNHPREVVEVGQEVHVRVLEIDKERRRISLTMKDTEMEPEEPVAAPAAEAREESGPGLFAAAWQEALQTRGRRGARR